MAASVIVFLLLQGRLVLSTQIIASWNVYCLSHLVLAWIAIIRANPAEIRRTVKLQDSSRSLIFILIIIAACASLMAVGFLLGPSKSLPRDQITNHVILSIISVIGSWLLMHTVFAIHYAHFFYSDEQSDASEQRAGGLEFPSEHNPDYLDFAYFSFVIGMTCQVSDVQISSRRIRRLALLDGILSFAFNTIILALSINVISGLI